MAHYVIRKGLNIPLSGNAQPVIENAPVPETIALRTADLPGIKFKVVVNEGDTVKLGQVLCYPRPFPDMVFRSPAGGVVREIRRGERRALEEIVIEPDDGAGEESFRVFSRSEKASAEIDDLRRHLLASGLWPLIQQRPLAKIARPDSRPAALYINAMDTAPLAADPSVLLIDREEDLAAGIRTLSRFCSGKTYVTVRDGADPVPGVDRLEGIEIHTFKGPHPAGSPGVHIRQIQPLKRGETAWCLTAADTADIGFLMRTGRFPQERIVAVAGSAVKEPMYYRTRIGAALSSLLDGQIDPSADNRIINGNVLTGTRTNADAHLAFNQSTVTVIPEGFRREFMGWGMPGFSRYSVFRTFASALLPRRRQELDTRLHGGVRPIISIGQWEKVFPFDIHLPYLLRAILAGDVQEAEDLGLLEVSEEDVALCAFVDPSKIEVCDIIRRGLDLYETEYL